MSSSVRSFSSRASSISKHSRLGKGSSTAQSSSSSSSTRSYEPLSNGPLLYSHQGALPQLPVASLSDMLASCERAANAYLPTISRGESQSRRLLDEAHKLLRSPLGQRLHSLLCNRAVEQHNWLEHWWRDEHRLAPRDPLPLRSTSMSLFLVLLFFCLTANTGAFLLDDAVFERFALSSSTSQAERAAALTLALLNTRRRVGDQSLSVEWFGPRPLCMTQAQHIFDSCRVPVESDVDRVEHHAHTAPRHIVVVHRGRWFALTATSASGAPYSREHLTRLFAALLEHESQSTSTATPLRGVAALTARDRDAWATARAALRDADVANVASLDAIERAAFVVCLDDAVDADADAGADAHRRLVARAPADCRWFDKPLQLVVFRNGSSAMSAARSCAHRSAGGAGVVCETSFVDASMWRHVVHNAFARSDARRDFDPSTSDAPLEWRHLPLTPPASLHSSLVANADDVSAAPFELHAAHAPLTADALATVCERMRAPLVVAR